jgi:hypothetical protein
MDTIDLSRAPEGYPIWIESNYEGEPSDWHKRIHNGYQDRQKGIWFDSKVASGECIVHERLAWTGEGCPPVGVPLEYQRRGAPNGKWYPTQINFLSGQHVIFCDSDGDEIRENPGDILFRPIRTPEQILHDEAMEEVPPIYGALVAHGLPRSQEAFDAVLAMWKAGYRKPEIVDE